MSPLGALVALLFGAQEAPAPQPAVLIVEFQSEAKFLGFPRHCPGATPEEDAEPALCTAVLYEGPIHTVRQVSGPRAIRAGKLRYTAHAYPMHDGMRLLVLAYPLKDGRTLFAPWWQWADSRDEVCLSADEARAIGIEVQWQRWRERVIVGEGDGVRYPVRCIVT